MVGTRQNQGHFNIWYFRQREGFTFSRTFSLLSSVKQNCWLVLLSSFPDGAVKYVLQPFIFKGQKKKKKHLPVEQTNFF